MVTMIDKCEKEIIEMKEKLKSYKGGEVELLSEEQINSIL